MNTTKPVIEDFKVSGMWSRCASDQLNEYQVKYFIRRKKSQIANNYPHPNGDPLDQAFLLTWKLLSTSLQQGPLSTDCDRLSKRVWDRANHENLQRTR